MSLFKKKNEERYDELQACTCKANKEEDFINESEWDNSCCCEKKSGQCVIKVLGSGCKNCKALYENAKKAVEDMDTDVVVEYITDMERIIKYSVMSMPAIVVNEKVVGYGKVYKPEEIKNMLKKLGC